MSITTLEKKLTAEENLLLKAELMQIGVQLDPALAPRVGKDFQEVVRMGLDYTYGPPKEPILLPMEFILSQFDSRVNFIPNPASPYLIREVPGDGEIWLYKNEEPICQVSLPPRPKFYSHKTSDGIEMKYYCLWFPVEACLCVMDTVCYYWTTGNQCRYCTIMADVMESQIKGLRDLRRVREAILVAKELQDIRRIIYGSGTLPGRQDVERALKLAEIAREGLASGDIFGYLNISQPEDFTDFDRLKEAGYKIISSDMEMWDKAWFEAVCPGKTKKIGRDRWLEGLEYSVQVFGPKRVNSFFVAGIEPKDGLLEGIDYLASKGIWGTPVPWIPGPGSKLEGHRQPPPSWFAELLKEGVRIWKSYGFTLEEYEFYVMTAGPHLLLNREAWLAVNEEEALKERGCVKGQPLYPYSK